MAICEVCGKTYHTYRSDSKTCGPACKRARARLKVTVKVTDAKGDNPVPVTVSGPDSAHARPGDPAYDGVALQEKYRNHWAHPEGVDFRLDDVPAVPDIPHSLPDCVPDIIKERYNRDGPEYRSTIDRLVSTSIDDLLAACVSVPVWRYQAGQASLMQAHTAP